jgi:hypothetical protein
VRRAKELKTESSAEDVAYVIRDNDIVPVKGVATGVADFALGFRYEAQDRKIALSRLLGVVLVRQRSAAPDATSFHQTLRLVNGDVLSGQWLSMKNGSLSIKTPWEQTLQFSEAAVASIENRNGRVVYLSDLKPAKVEQTPFFDRIIPWRGDSALDGGLLKLNDGQEYAKGIDMHSRCLLEYDLGGEFEQFKARLGFEPMPSPIGRAAVRVIADGRAVYDNPDLRADRKPQDLELDVRGVKRLSLLVDFGQDQDAGDRVVWAEARLLRADVGK